MGNQRYAKKKIIITFDEDEMQENFLKMMNTSLLKIGNATKVKIHGEIVDNFGARISKIKNFTHLRISGKIIK